MAALVVVLIRFLLPFTILRWSFWGAILAILGDISDVVLMDAFGWGWFEGRDYHTYDKLFDTYYLGFEVYMALKWQEVLARRTAVFLFSWRLLGIIAFEILKVKIRASYWSKTGRESLKRENILLPRMYLFLIL